MNYTDYQNNEKRLRSLTGLSGEQFRELLPCFEDAHNGYLSEYDMNGKYRNHRRSFTIYPPGVIIEQPVKKRRGKEFTAEEKEYDRKVASFRIRVEHATSSAKHMRIVKDERWLRANGFVKRIFKSCAALHNFRIKINPWHYEY
jgi:hypothetical protein